MKVIFSMTLGPLKVEEVVEIEEQDGREPSRRDIGNRLDEWVDNQLDRIGLYYDWQKAKEEQP